MKQYQHMITTILSEGGARDDRTKVGTYSVFGYQMEFNLAGWILPIVTLKRTPFLTMSRELEWFLSGSTSNRVLKNMKTKIWDDWENSIGDLGPIYSAMWRRWPTYGDRTILIDLEKHRLSDDELVSSIRDLRTVQETADALYVNPDYRFDKDAIDLYLSIIADAIDAGVEISKRWLDFKTFQDDIATIPNYEEWRARPSEWVLSHLYYGQNTYDVKTTLFIHTGYDIFLGELEIPMRARAEENIAFTPGFKIEDNKTHIVRYAHNSTEASNMSGIDEEELWTIYDEHEVITSEYKITLVDKRRELVRRRYFVDQIAELIENLKKRPFDRRHIVNGWNPAFLPEADWQGDEIRKNPDVGDQVLPPCHTMFQFYVKEMSISERQLYLAIDDKKELIEFLDNIEGSWHEKFDEMGIPKYSLSCKLYQRSADTILGVPFNIASYSLMTMALAKDLGMAPGKFIWSGGDCHIYSNHLDQAHEILNRDPRPLPKLIFKDSYSGFMNFKATDVELQGYDPHPVIEADVAQ